MRSEGASGRVREREREVFVLCEKEKEKKEKIIWWKGVIAGQREREIFMNVG